MSFLILEVVGISKEALNVFKSQLQEGFSWASTGHIYDRNETLTYMLEHPFNDLDGGGISSTVEIVRSSWHQNVPKVGDYYEVPEGLFHTQGFAWKHGKDEVDFLTELAHA